MGASKQQRSNTQHPRALSRRDFLGDDRPRGDGIDRGTALVVGRSGRRQQDENTKARTAGSLGTGSRAA